MTPDAAPAKNCFTAGFSLLELMVALAIASLLVGLTAPVAMRLHESMKYRSAVGELVAGLATARHQAIQRGQPVDLSVEPDAHRFRVHNQPWKPLPDSLKFSMVSAQELSSAPEQGIIRFYPDGSASGGSIEIVRKSGAGVILEVDWLLGSVKQSALTDAQL